MLFHALVINVKKFTNLELPDEGGNFLFVSLNKALCFWA